MKKYKDIVIILLIALNIVTLFFTLTFMDIAKEQSKIIEGYKKDC